MSRAASSGFILFFRRAYTVAAGDSTAAASTMIRNAVDPNIIDTDKVAKGLTMEVFWMRDSKTGDWLPETHFDQVDVAELRAKFLKKKQ